jgi:urease accessory protein UreF
MAINSLIQSYSQLQSQLQQLAFCLEQGQLEPNQAIATGQQLLQFWQTQLATSTGENLAPQVLAQWQSLHIELHRELRLLNLDLMFFGRSLAPETKAIKQKNVGDRLNKLQQYCTHIIQTLNNHPDPPDKPAT